MVKVCLNYSDGARAMSRKLTDFITRTRVNNSLIKWHHCFIYRVALATRKMKIKLKKVFDEAVKIVNFIKARALHSRLFHELCQYMYSDHQQLLLHTEVQKKVSWKGFVKDF